MRSTRLPGKVMMDLAGRSVLSHVLERCRAVPGIDRVICATVASPECDALAEEAKRAGVAVFRGDESDVLGRYHQAAEQAGADVVLRVTSDCPMIDPDVCGQVVQSLQDAGADFASNNAEPKSWPHGLDCEAFTFAWLDKAALEATAPFDREHVGPYIRKHASAKVNVACPDGDFSAHRWTLDTPEDLVALRRIFARLPQGRPGWSWRAGLDAEGR
jgi:spore coat polysaccharide biosynthesis protein SpsF (cytidylyltransferase family)